RGDSGGRAIVGFGPPVGGDGGAPDELGDLGPATCLAVRGPACRGDGHDVVVSRCVGRYRSALRPGAGGRSRPPDTTTRHSGHRSGDGGGCGRRRRALRAVHEQDLRPAAGGRVSVTALRTLGDPILSAPCENLWGEGTGSAPARTALIVDEMTAALRGTSGVAIAANQLGHSLRIVVI